ncbi:MAG: molecular chaperone TorD family protein, partial [Candidatus Atribacteria bacterium]|nr:molecular chaperone TorD family protein [Candidatus Atribacteria bacterium]
MFQLLALAMHLPEKELAEGLVDGSILADVTALFRELGIKPRETHSIENSMKEIKKGGESRQEMLSSLRKEYTRLFSHPKKPVIYIYETLFLFKPEKGSNDKPPLFISPAAMDAERCYKKAGLKMSKEINEPGDHMATEMEFMMYLYQQKSNAIREDDREELARRNAEIEEFGQSHLKRWAKEFFRECKTTSESRFYRTIGEI